MSQLMQRLHRVGEDGKHRAGRDRIEQIADVVVARGAGHPEQISGVAASLRPVRQALGLQFHLLSRLRVTSMLYDLAPECRLKQRGVRRKYGQKLGSAADLAAQRVRVVTVLIMKSDSGTAFEL